MHAMGKTKQTKKPYRLLFRGAQPGNVNALKHGFYSERFRKGEIEDLSALAINDLSSEISAMRVVTRRMLVNSEDDETKTQILQTLYALGMAAGRVASLIRTQALLHGTAADDFANAASLALQSFMEDHDIQ